MHSRAARHKNEPDENEIRFHMMNLRHVKNNKIKSTQTYILKSKTKRMRKTETLSNSIEFPFQRGSQNNTVS